MAPDQGDAQDRGARNRVLLRSVVWDANGERLAVLLGESHPQAGKIALYASSARPVLSLRFLGLVQPPAGSPAAEVLVFAPAPRAGGALLAVRGSLAAGGERVHMVPLMFRSSAARPSALAY